MPTLRATLTLAATLAGCTPSAPPAEESAVPPPSEPTAAAPPSTATATPDAPAAADPDAPTAADPDAPAAADPDAPPTAFQAVVRILTAEERAAMTGVSWHEGCPVPLSDLRVLELTHHRPEGPSARGQLIAHADAAEVLVGAFETLWDIGFPITRMEPVRVFGGDDNASMKADNTSAFNCRPVLGGRSWSQHAYGRAVDVNPLRNPFTRGHRVDPPEGRDWLERDANRPGVLVTGTPAVEAFRALGWGWGGHWTSSKDYQHFSATGR